MAPRLAAYLRAHVTESAFAWWIFPITSVLTAFGASLSAGMHLDEEMALANPWALPAAMLFTGLLAWPPHLRRPTAFFAIVQTFVVVVSAIGCVLAGLSLPAALWVSLASMLSAVVTQVLWRRYGRVTDSWLMDDVHGVVVLCLAGAAGVAVGGLICAYPHSGPICIQEHPYVTLAILVRGWVTVVVSAMVFLPIDFGSRQPAASSALRAGMIAVVQIAIGIPLQLMYPSVPLTWIAALGVLMAGVYLTRRAAALVMLFDVAILVGTPYPDFPPGPEGILAAIGSYDLLIAFSAIVMFVTAADRERRAAMTASVATRAARSAERGHVLTTIFQAMNDGVILTRPDGLISAKNAAVARILGRPVPERLDRDWVAELGLREAVGRQALDADAILRRMAEPGQGYVANDLVLLPPGETQMRTISLVHQELPSAGEPMTLLMVKDTTADEARRRQLKAFAGTVAHDLKGPLTALAGWVEAAADEVGDGDAAAARAALARAAGASTRMRGIIDDYLSFTVAREGELHPTDVHIEPLAREVAALYASGDESVVVEADAPHAAHADAGLVRQLLANLVGNSVKYSRPGEGTYIRVTSRDAGDGRIEIAVADKGLGIAPGEEDTIFDQYSRSDKDAATHHGIGLGLSLCHTIVTRHGGTIRAEHNEWNGATFRFTLPEAAGGRVGAAG